jgi:hypothetical protein
MSAAQLEAVKAQLQKYLDQGYIRQSSSPAAAPVLFVKKPSGGLRFCADYRGLNDCTVKNRYPLPFIKETLGRAAKARFFTKLDVVSAFHKIRIAAGDEWKTAFRTRFGLFEYLVMPFGLTNAPATFQAFVNNVLGLDLLESCASAYLDDILIYSETEEQHHRHVKEVLRRLRQARLFLDIAKCEFHVTSVRYLGMILHAARDDRPGTVEIDPAKLEVIRNWEPPRSQLGLRRFLGFANFCRRFIKGYSGITKPLTEWTMDAFAKSFPWGPQSPQQRAFDELKRRFTTAPVLRAFDPDLPATMITDASDFAIGAILKQPGAVASAGAGVEGALHPVAFFSKKLSGAELNYDVHDKELLAIVRAFEEWRPELAGTATPVRVLSDHRNLQWFRLPRPLSSRQARWSEFLHGNFNFKIEYLPGPRCEADPLTRREQDRDPEATAAARLQTLLPATCFLAALGVDEVALQPADLLDQAYLGLSRSDELSRTRAALRAGVLHDRALPLLAEAQEKDGGKLWVWDRL